MTRKGRRLAFVVAGMAILGAAAALTLSAFDDSLVFFYSPTDLKAKDVAPGRSVRIGGLVEEGSVERAPDGKEVHFRVTDLKQTVNVVYRGILPDLFREGQGVVVEGKVEPGGGFRAAEVLAKHDETYMPPEVAEALKKSGRWQEGAGKAARK
jgi:cytochrome c-type biogenesis protein CcmE